MQRDQLRSELKAIITASKLFVKRLRNRSAHIHAGHFTNLCMKSMNLMKRDDMLLPGYRRHVDHVKSEFDYQVELAYERFPDLKKASKRTTTVSGESKEPTKSVKVSITLPEFEWVVIDEIIKAGSVLSRSEYFRKLHSKSQRR
ncbi:hypothetical protein [Paenibacillus luteus]|uniref:hypothetical protein n=1 Tax=Paenibacillus luteus TaxID=2545753 RepID=UPI00114250E4|nr:hypothetical protein [Paenibacillus luteus]